MSKPAPDKDANNRVVAVTLDEESIGRSGPDIEHERAIGHRQGDRQVRQATTEAPENIVQRNRVATAPNALRDTASRKLGVVQPDKEEVDFVPLRRSAAHEIQFAFSG